MSLHNDNYLYYNLSKVIHLPSTQTVFTWVIIKRKDDITFKVPTEKQPNTSWESNHSVSKILVLFFLVDTRNNYYYY